MKVLLIDDHPMVQNALQELIRTLDAQVVVLTVDGPDTAFARLGTETGIDLVLLDLLLGRAVDGFTLLADLRLQYPRLPVVVISAVDRLADMVRVIDMGAMGFVPKCASAPELFEALSLVLAGGVYIPPALLALAHLPGHNLAEAAAAADQAADAAAELAVQHQRAGLRSRVAAAAGGGGPVLQAMGERVEPAAALPLPADPAEPISLPVPMQLTGLALERAWLAAMGLTPRQSDVLALLLKGLPNKLIARELNVSVDTVKDHVAAVLRALGVNSRTQAVVAVGRHAQANGVAVPKPF